MPIPAANISLRSASAENVVLQAEAGDRPLPSVRSICPARLWMVHPKAVYLHEGQQYFVQELDLEKHTAVLIPVGLDYYTEPQRETEIAITARSSRRMFPAAKRAGARYR